MTDILTHSCGCVETDDHQIRLCPDHYEVYLAEHHRHFMGELPQREDLLITTDMWEKL